MAINNFLPFCPTDSGTNLLSQAAYAAASDRTSGNQPGVASSKLNNKALRQATYVVSQMAQYISNTLGVDVLDDATPSELLLQMVGTFNSIPTIIRSFTSSGTFARSYVFFIATGSATAGATYTNNTQTFTVLKTVSSATQIIMTSVGAPSASGTLTKATGTGDATLTFAFVRIPSYMVVEAVGAGAGGQGGAASGGSPGLGSAGGDTLFGSLITAGGGQPVLLNGGAAGGLGGTGSIDSTLFGEVTLGSQGQGNFEGDVNIFAPGGAGGSSPGFGGGGSGCIGQDGTSGAANTGGGGAGGSSPSSTFALSGGGGGSGARARAVIPNPTSSYSITIGAGGAFGALAIGGQNGGNGADGKIVTYEYFQ